MSRLEEKKNENERFCCENVVQIGAKFDIPQGREPLEVFTQII